MSLALFVIDGALAVLGLQWLSDVVEPGTFALIVLVVTSMRMQSPDPTKAVG
jgi:hypothetical protein